jgi:ATP dependent DNA ligase C terminal region
LYVPHAERERSFAVSEAVADEAAHDLHFAAFDVIGATEPLGATLKQLEGLLPATGKVHVIAQQTVNSRAAVLSLYASHVQEKGAEGIVLRAPDRSGFKLKTRHHLDLVVIGYSEGSGEQAGLLRNILLAAMHPDGTLQVVGKAGGGFSDEQRREWLTQLAAMRTPSEFVEVAERQTAFEMVSPQWVVECTCIDMLTEDGGRPVSKMRLNHSADRGYTTAGAHPCVNMISPVFIRRRDDKSVNATDLRFSQISDVVELGSKEAATGDVSTRLKREVYTKEAKGEVAVRKFVAWKTNKETTGKYPAYVLFYTDFSASRAEPLKQDITVAPTEEAVLTLFAQAVAENIKKGWVLQVG